MTPDETGIWVFAHSNGIDEEIPVIWDEMGPEVWDLVPYGDELPANCLADFRAYGKWIRRKSDLPSELVHLGRKESIWMIPDEPGIWAFITENGKGFRDEIEVVYGEVGKDERVLMVRTEDGYTTRLDELLGNWKWIGKVGNPPDP